LKNNQAISSADLFGEDNSSSNQESLGSKLKGFAYNFTVNLADKAKDVKEKTSNYITKIQNKYGNN
jgi:hypothetical protein